MSSVYVVGIDPGPVPGIVGLQFVNRVLLDVDILQCSHHLAPVLLSTLLRGGGGEDLTLVQVENFVVSRRSSRSSTPKAGQQTRELIGSLQQTCQGFLIPVGLQTASRVKTWASDERLETAGLLEATKGMRHAKDAARHALFCAVAEANQPDPLSKEWRTA